MYNDISIDTISRFADRLYWERGLYVEPPRSSTGTPPLYKILSDVFYFYCARHQQAAAPTEQNIGVTCSQSGAGHPNLGWLEAVIGAASETVINGPNW